MGHRNKNRTPDRSDCAQQRRNGMREQKARNHNHKKGARVDDAKNQELNQKISGKKGKGQ